jgi:hypothetical protein
MSKPAAILGAAFLAVFAAGFAAPACADETPELARDALRNVPVFFIADDAGQPSEGAADDKVAFYLTRQQASIALGLARGDRAVAGLPADDLRVEVIDLARAAAFAEPHRFVKPATRIEAAARMADTPLFLVRDAEGAPYTIKGEDGRRRVYFYLSETDAHAFMGRILRETKRTPSDLRLSIVTLEGVLDSIMTSDDPLVQNWEIWANADVRSDAADLRAELSPFKIDLATAN